MTEQTLCPRSSHHRHIAVRWTPLRIGTLTSISSVTCRRAVGLLNRRWYYRGRISEPVVIV